MINSLFLSVRPLPGPKRDGDKQQDFPEANSSGEKGAAGLLLDSIFPLHNDGAVTRLYK